MIAMGEEGHKSVRKSGFVSKLRSTVESNRKSVAKFGFADKLRKCVQESRREEIEVEEYMKCMEMYKQIADDPFKFTFDDMLMVEDVLDAMLMSAVIDQRKHRKYAEDALKQMQSVCG
jgi:hypothetical protein